MSYRTTSSYDPLAQQMPGRILRPFNAIQWLGVVMTAGGGLLGLSFLIARFGWTPSLTDSPAVAFWLFIVGSFLVSYRREPGRLMTEAEVRKTRHWVIGSFLVSLLAVGAIIFLGGFS